MNAFSDMVRTYWLQRREGLTGSFSDASGNSTDEETHFSTNKSGGMIVYFYFKELQVSIFELRNV